MLGITRDSGQSRSAQMHSMHLFTLPPSFTRSTHRTSPKPHPLCHLNQPHSTTGLCLRPLWVSISHLTLPTWCFVCFFEISKGQRLWSGPQDAGADSLIRAPEVLVSRGFPGLPASVELGEVGSEAADDCWEKKACLGGGPLEREGSLGRSTLRLEKSSPGGITFMSGMLRPTLCRALSTRSSFTSYLARHMT